MRNLILDCSVVIEACRNPDSNALLFETLNSARKADVDIWIYTAEASSILQSLSSTNPLGETSGNQKENNPKSLFKAFVCDCQWLATLADDLSDLDCADLVQAALLKASARLGDDTKILTFSQDRLKSGLPFISLTELVSLPPEKQISFIDLRRQQSKIRGSLESRIHQVLHHGRYVFGSEIEDLELQLANYVGVSHCVCVSSGTDALLASLMAIEIQPGDEVITSPFSFFATAEVMSLLGAVPMYVDIEPTSFNIDATKIEAAITPRTRAIVPVSLYGQCADMDVINEIAIRHDLIVIEDAAQSFGATYKGKRSGSLSNLACTSFFPAKPLGAYGDGGACFTDDPGLAELLRQVRDHGQDSRYHHVRIGINGRMDTLQAAVLLSKIPIFEDEINRRQLVASRYLEGLLYLQRQGGLVLPEVRGSRTSSWAQYTIRLSDREAVRAAMAQQGIPTTVHYPTTLYSQPALRDRSIDCPESESAAESVLSLPMHPYLEKEAQGQIIKSLAGILGSDGSDC
tara:strand:+ start:373 stop:1923 length:1551 start_codon:yes stop_codon:yes gene_type:complete